MILSAAPDTREPDAPNLRAQRWTELKMVPGSSTVLGTTSSQPDRATDSGLAVLTHAQQDELDRKARAIELRPRSASTNRLELPQPVNATRRLPELSL